jgi:hypothetical protein
LSQAIPTTGGLSLPCRTPDSLSWLSGKNADRIWRRHLQNPGYSTAIWMTSTPATARTSRKTHCSRRCTAGLTTPFTWMSTICLMQLCETRGSKCLPQSGGSSMRSTSGTWRWLSTRTETSALNWNAD